MSGWFINSALRTIATHMKVQSQFFKIYLKKSGWKVWTGFNWLRIGTSGMLL
jgi:hypothetical protein